MTLETDINTNLPDNATGATDENSAGTFWYERLQEAV